jgi:hypothetical protein
LAKYILGYPKFFVKDNRVWNLDVAFLLGSLLTAAQQLQDDEGKWNGVFCTIFLKISLTFRGLEDNANSVW